MHETDRGIYRTAGRCLQRARQYRLKVVFRTWGEKGTARREWPWGSDWSDEYFFRKSF